MFPKGVKDAFDAEDDDQRENPRSLSLFCSGTKREQQAERNDRGAAEETIDKDYKSWMDQWVGIGC